MNDEYISDEEIEKEILEYMENNKEIEENVDTDNNKEVYINHNISIFFTKFIAIVISICAFIAGIYLAEDSIVLMFTAWISGLVLTSFLSGIADIIENTDTIINKLSDK